MKTIDDYTNELKKNMTINDRIHPRFYHSLQVASMCLKLNEIHHLKLDETKLYLAGVLHDCAKLYPDELLYQIMEDNYPLIFDDELKKTPWLWHSFAGAFVAENEYGIMDKEILSSIYYHTVGKEEMSKMEQVVFVSDYIEESRVGSMFDTARRACFLDLDKGTYIILKQTLDYLENNGKMVFSQTRKTFDYYKKKMELK